MFVLFLAGMLAGSATNLRHQQMPPLSQLISNGIFCGFFGIVGGAVATFFLPDRNQIMMVASGVVCSCVVALFSNEEIKAFSATVIRKVVATIFNLKLK